MTDLEKARQAVEKGDATALLGLADALCDKAHPDAAELASLAVEVSMTEDWSVAVMAATVFLAILESKKE